MSYASSAKLTTRDLEELKIRSGLAQQLAIAPLSAPCETSKLNTASEFGKRIQSLREMLLWRGPFRCAALALREVMRPIVDWYVLRIIEGSVAEACMKPPTGPQYPVKFFTLADGMDAIAAEVEPIRKLRPIDESRLKQGDTLAIAYAGDAPVGCVWMAFQSGLGIAAETAWLIGPGEAVAYDSFVVPAWRGKRVHGCLDQVIHRYFQQRGIVRLLGSMSVLNPQTLSLAKRTDKRTTMTLILVTIRGVNWNFRFALGQPLAARFRAQRMIATTASE
jgi:hypothetical protein